MATGDDSRRGEGSSSAVTAPTLPGRDLVDSDADTAAATPSLVGASAQASVDGESLVGTVLEQRYEITRQIGRGGMGAVYEATHKLIGKRVAVKVLLEKYAQKDPIVARLEQEARLASSIGHPNIIDITDIGHSGGRTFVVMEYLDGESLGACITREGQLPSDRAIRIARQIASALGAAHAKGVVHRDLKPENVFLLRRDREDFIKVVDFGISKLMRSDDEAASSPRLTQTGMVLGTPLYMSPEQAKGDDKLDHRIDVYALGVILYEMVTGEVPFRGTNYLSVLAQVVAEEPIAPREKNGAITPDLDAIIMKALEKDPAARYQSMEELAEDLAILQTTDGGVATTGARITAARRKKRKGRGRRGANVRWILTGLALLGAGIAIVIAFEGRGPEPAAAPPTAARALPPPHEAPPHEAVVVAPPIEKLVVHIASIPPGATVYRDDRIEGTTPFDLPMAKGEVVDLTAELAGHADSKLHVNADLDAERGVQFKLRPGRPSGRSHKPVGDGHAPGGDHPAGTDDTAGGDLTGNTYRRP